MFCKTCGQRIPPSSAECPYCGAVVAAEDANPVFLDVTDDFTVRTTEAMEEVVPSDYVPEQEPAAEPVYEAPAEEPAYTAPVQEAPVEEPLPVHARSERKPAPQKSRVGGAAVLLGVLVCVSILSIVSLIMSLSAKSASSTKAEQSDLKALQSTTVALQEEIDTLKAELASARAEVERLSTTLDGIRSEIHVLEITHMPTSESQPVGYTDHGLFVVEVSTPSTFQWQKLADNGKDWVNLGAAFAGVRVENKETVSILSAGGLTAADGGTYRCMVTSAEGQVVYTDSVTLTVQAG